MALSTVALIGCGAEGRAVAEDEDGAAGEDVSLHEVSAPEVSVHGEGAANRLQYESSPYLRLHAANPVDWFPWGEEALEKARRENKPIFLSVGYSTCYWCHVMEREVFSDPDIAALMNRGFVCIKVDREERPDLDEIYMTATQLMTGSGGWPNSVFLTPALEPFFAGTYFPPEDSRGRPGFPKVLRSLEEAWRTRRPEVEARAQRVSVAMARVLTERGGGKELPDLMAAKGVVDGLVRRYDRINGGFGGAPKFPSPANLFLLWQRAEAGDAEAREIVVDTLRKMGRGAIYDQLDGGFHRYTLDTAWRIPHFEKMLYDNAHLAELLALAGAATGDAELIRLARGTLDFVLDTMQLPNGAFKSAIDAETDGVEGAYYIWGREELEKILGKEGVALLSPIFGFDGSPNVDGRHYTLFLTGGLQEHADRRSISTEELAGRLEPWLEVLRETRSQRPFPRVDDKVLTDWNGMMVAALARGGHRLQEPRYIDAAERAAIFLLGLRDEDGIQLHVWREGKARIRAFVDDYAFFVRGLLALHEATGSERWLQEAERLSVQLQSRLAHPLGGYVASAAKDGLLVQPRQASDGAIPSGNSIAILNLMELAGKTGNEEYRLWADAALRGFGPELARSPGGSATLAQATFRLHEGRAVSAGKAEPGGTGDVSEMARGLVKANIESGAPEMDDSGDTWSLRLEIRDGWHLNAHPASMDFLVPTSLDGPVRSVQYPPGRPMKLGFTEETLSVYSDSVRIHFRSVSRAENVRLTYQACDDRRCLPPITQELVLPGAQ